VLIVTRSGILRHTLPVAVSSVVVTVNQDLKALSPRNGIMAEYVAWALRAFGRDILNTCSKQGTTVNSVETAKLLRFEIPVAPTEQQRSIVAEIEKQFSRLDEAVANLKRVKANLKRYKASVLKAAVEGKLTEAWRKQHPSVEPASKLLERILAERRREERFNEPDPLDTTLFDQLPNGWCWSRIEDLGSVQLGRQRAPKYHSGHNMRPYLRVQNVFEDHIDLEDVKEMDFPRDDYEKFKLKSGDILLNEGQSPHLLGRPAIYRGELPGACFTNTLIRFKADPPVTPEYPLIVFRAYMRTGRFTREGTITTNIAHLSAGRFAKIEFPVPPLREQREIVAEVERRLSVIAKLEATVEANLTRADRLRQAVLSQAFAGKLTCVNANRECRQSADIETARA
jgi:type I restriction enzyme S subunit